MAAAGRRLGMKAKALVPLKYRGVWYEPGSTVDLKGLSKEELKHLRAVGAIRLDSASRSNETSEEIKPAKGKTKRGK
mgnify:CR=1 FL=1